MIEMNSMNEQELLEINGGGGILDTVADFAEMAGKTIIKQVTKVVTIVVDIVQIQGSSQYDAKGNIVLPNRTYSYGTSSESTTMNQGCGYAP